MYLSETRKRILISWADIKRAEDLFGWKPAVGIEQGLKEAVRWYHDYRRESESKRSQRIEAK